MTAISVGAGAALVAVVLVAATVQGIVGFGFALFVAPVTAAVLDPRAAVVVVTLLGSVIPIGMAWSNRTHVVREAAGRISIGVVLGAPLGLLVLLNVPTRGLKITIAVAVLGSVLILWRGAHLHAARPAIDVGMGIVSGALATSTGTNGPPVVLVLQARRLDPDEFRATSAVCLVVANVIAAALLVATGQINVRLVTLCAVGVPADLLGWWAGFRLRQRLHPGTFRSVVLAFLAASAVVAIAVNW